MFMRLAGTDSQSAHPPTEAAMNDPQQQIVDQLTEIAWVLDHKEWDRLGEIFTEDAEGYGQQGLAAITANTIRYLGRCGPTQHLTGNHRIRLDGDRATSTSYIRAIHFSAPGRPVQHWDSSGSTTTRGCAPLQVGGSLAAGVGSWAPSATSSYRWKTTGEAALDVAARPASTTTGRCRRWPIGRGGSSPTQRRYRARPPSR